MQTNHPDAFLKSKQSILGPHPLSPKDTYPPKPSHILNPNLSPHINPSQNRNPKPIHSLNRKNNPTSYPYNNSPTMDDLTLEDEQLIQKFIGLNTDEHFGPIVNLPEEVTSSTDWSCTIIAKVITNRPVQDSAFQTNMVKAWNINPATRFCSLGNNAFQVEFLSEIDTTNALVGGLWTFRGDLVATRKAASPLTSNPDLITTAELWVQFFNAPINLTDKGVEAMVQPIGVPISLPIEGFIGGRRFVKVKTVGFLGF